MKNNNSKSSERMAKALLLLATCSILFLMLSNDASRESLTQPPRDESVRFFFIIKISNYKLVHGILWVKKKLLKKQALFGYFK